MVDGMLKFENCAGAEGIQSVDSEHDMDMKLWVNSQCLSTADRKSTDGDDPLNSTYLNATDTELTLNAIDSEPH